MASYFDSTDQSLKIVEYTWAELSSETWADYTDWQQGSVNFGSLSGIGDATPDIEYFTNIIDFGSKAWVNPLCTVDAVGDVSIKVFSSETQPSDFITGDPGIIGGTNLSLEAIYGRYFQFKVEVFSSSVGQAQLNKVNTTLSSRTQSEFFQESSTLHNGTSEMRYPTLANTYSKILSLNGHAKLVDTDDSTPLLVTGIGDRSANAISITNSGGVDAVEDVYKFEPAALRFNDNTGSGLIDTDDNLTFSMSSTGITTGNFTFDFWYQPVKMTWLDGISSPPNYAHSPYFFHLDTAGTDIYLRTGTANGAIEILYSLNGSTWTSTGQFVNGNNPTGDWYHIRVGRSGSTLYVKNHNLGTKTVGTYTQDISSATMRLGDLGGNATVGNFYIDDFRLSDAFRVNDTIPGAEPIIDGNTQFLLTGQTSNVTPGQTNVPVITVGALTDRTQARYAVYRTSGQVVDADVAIQVVGLRALSSDSNGNIIEG